MQTFENTQQNSLILHTNSPWVHVILFVQMVAPPFCTLVCIIKLAQVVKIIMLNYKYDLYIIILL